MPGETKIFKNTNGWYNVEKPGVYHATRDAARAARKATITNTYVAAHTTPVIPDNAQASTFAPRGLSELRQRLFDRLTKRQGVDPVDALSVITSNGHNAAASYGHMREAGATHDEALSVIWRGSPSVSLAYGHHRAYGYNHADALRDALVIGDVDDNDD